LPSDWSRELGDRQFILDPVHRATVFEHQVVKATNIAMRLSKALSSSGDFAFLEPVMLPRILKIPSGRAQHVAVCRIAFAELRFDNVQAAEL
jgi:hypothetical protein